MARDPDCVIVCPVEYDGDPTITRHRIEGSEHKFSEKLNWEEYYIKKASKHGCVIAWFPLESKVNPRAKADGPYAFASLIQLGRWGAITTQFGLNMVVGIEPGFYGIDRIRQELTATRNYTLSEMIEGDPAKSPIERFPIWSTLEDAVSMAVQIAQRG